MVRTVNIWCVYLFFVGYMHMTLTVLDAVWDKRLPPQLLYGELSLGQWSADDPKKCFMDHIRSILLKYRVNLSDNEASTSDRDVSKAVCQAG